MGHRPHIPSTKFARTTALGPEFPQKVSLRFSRQVRANVDGVGRDVSLGIDKAPYHA